MNWRKNQHNVAVFICGAVTVMLAGCSTVGGAASDLGLAGAGGVVGYQVSDGKIGGAAAGAALGYVGSKIAQSEIQRATTDAEKRGFDRGMNQAVKQQYWVMQAQQREPVQAAEKDLKPVVIPESKINGVVYNAHVEYLRVER
jgi:hypothetical protein